MKRLCAHDAANLRRASTSLTKKGIEQFEKIDLPWVKRA
jgi:hypothetical protein